MCGISGILNFEFESEVSEKQLRQMSDAQRHRGPDDEGIYMKRNLGFSFRRLSIIDLHSGHQPLSNEDGWVWIVFNGEIYNFQALRKDLVARGHQFKTKTDTETIVHLYEEYGKDCVQHLRGMFGFAIWDERNKKLFCARDRFGIKPFFYHLDNNRFAFASEIKSILALGDIDQAIDVMALDSYFTYKYITDNRTIFKQIKKLKPAHTLEISFHNKKPKIKIERYWDILYQPNFIKTEAEWCEVLEAEISEAVKLRLVSDVPLGAFLSGGIDSSIVVALMAGYSSSPINTFSIGFKEKAFNELPYAREVAERYETNHHEQIIEPESVSLVPKLAWAYDEPFADTSAIPTYYVSKFAREYVTVVLSGDGGDELFAGYNSYPKFQNLRKYNVMPDAFNRSFWMAIHKAMPGSMYGKALSYYLSQQKKHVAAHFAMWLLPERKKLYKAGLWNELDNKMAEQYKTHLLQQSATKDYLSKMQELDMRTFMVDDILTKVDRASMLNSLEVRVPILDHKVAELSFQIPSNFKLKGNNKKYILKQAMKKYLPDSIIAHKKQGFTVPMKLWFNDSLNDYVNDKLHSHNNLLSEYLNLDYVQQILADHKKGMRDLNEKIWSLIFLDAWLEQYEKVKL